MDTTSPKIGLDLLRLTIRLRDMDKRLSVQMNFTIDELHCIGIIYIDRPSCVKKLSEMLELSPTRMSKILWNLERGGFVTRRLDLADHRKEQIALTDEGRKAAEKILSLYSNMGDNLIENWPAEFASDFSWLKQTQPSSDQ